jgi:hypothetical protein
MVRQADAMTLRGDVAAKALIPGAVRATLRRPQRVVALRRHVQESAGSPNISLTLAINPGGGESTGGLDGPSVAIAANEIARYEGPRR